MPNNRPTTSLSLPLEAPNSTYHLLVGHLPKRTGGFPWHKSIPILDTADNTDIIPLAPWKVASAVTPDGDLIVAGSFSKKMTVEIEKGNTKVFEA